MLYGNERKAYFRIPVHEIMYSSDPDCKGELCSKLQTILLKWPGAEADEKENQERVPALVRVKLWFGLEKDEKDWVYLHNSNDIEGILATYAETV